MRTISVIKRRKDKPMFWGVLLIVAGISMVLSFVLKVDIPIFRIAAAFFLIYFGCKMLFGSFDMEFRPKITDDAAVFGKGHFNVIFDKDENPKSEDSDKDDDDDKDEEDFSKNFNSSSTKKYSIAFGSGVIDLTKVDLSDASKTIKLDLAFGSSQVLIKKGTPYKLAIDNAFAKVTAPGKNMSWLGDIEYTSSNYDPKQNHLNIRGSNAFSNLEIIEN